jgi:hypothetical protein
VGRRRDAPPALLFFLIVVMVAAVGCGVGPAGVVDERDGPNEASLGGAYVPAGFGEGSLWATDIFTCDDAGPAPFGWFDGGGDASCGAPAGMPIKRLDPRTGEEEARVELEDFSANVTEVAFGADSVWVSSADYHPGPVEVRQPWDASSTTRSSVCASAWTRTCRARNYLRWSRVPPSNCP